MDSIPRRLMPSRRVNTLQLTTISRVGVGGYHPRRGERNADVRREAVRRTRDDDRIEVVAPVVVEQARTWQISRRRRLLEIENPSEAVHAIFGKRGILSRTEAPELRVV